MIRFTEFEVGEWKYKMSAMPFGRSRPLLIKLQKLLAPAIASATDTGSIATGEDAALRAILSGLSSLLASIDDQLAGEITKELTECTECSNDGGNKWPALRGMSTHWDGRLGDWFEFVRQGLIFNYSDFLDRMIALLANVIPAKARSGSQSPPIG